MTKTKLSIVPPPPPRPELEDLGKDELAGYLRQFMNVARDLCDAAEYLIGPEHPAPRPQLRVVPGGRAVRK